MERALMSHPAAQPRVLGELARHARVPETAREGAKIGEAPAPAGIEPSSQHRLDAPPHPQEPGGALV
jgi:hypothetical protein